MRSRALGVAVVAAAAAAAPAAPAAGDAATILKSNMTGAQIVNPQGGAPNGVADAILRVKPRRGRVCFSISYAGLGGRATSGFLRRGAQGEMSRPLAILFSARAGSPVKGCVRGVRKRPLRRLVADPGEHYVDLATRKRSKGAVRGQLLPTTGAVAGPPSGGSSPGRR